MRGKNFRVGDIFRTHPDGFWGPPILVYNGCRVILEAKAAEVKERVELYA